MTVDRVADGGMKGHTPRERQMTEIDTLKSKVAKQRNEIARLEQKVAELAMDKLQMHRDILVLKSKLGESND
jgi:uncharacterized coiled-coil protein SlyX